MTISSPQYYYLVAGLPDILYSNRKITQTLNELKLELKEELVPTDYVLVKTLLLSYDNKNIISLLNKKELPGLNMGNYSYSELENAIKTPEASDLNNYLTEFILSCKENKKEGINYKDENTLHANYFKYVKEITNNSFLLQWLDFNCKLKNLVVALNCRTIDISPEDHLVGNDTFTNALRTSKEQDFGLGGEYSFVDLVMNAFKGEDMEGLESTLDKIRWEFLDESTETKTFSVEAVLAHLIKTEIVQRWQPLSKEKGQQIFEQQIEQMKQSYKQEA